MFLKKILFCLGTILIVLPGYSTASDCMTSACHSKFAKNKVLHSPLSEDCLICHVQKEKHKFEPVSKIRKEICFDCHDNKKNGKYIHGAMKIKECIYCHDPHASENKSLLKKERIDTICFECHENNHKDKKFVHGPLISGNCSLCHETHVSNQKLLLLEEESVLCAKCHQDKNPKAPNMKMHSPMKNGCKGCHDSHASNNPFQLLSPPEQLCGNCHKKILEETAKVKIKHPIVEKEKKCMNCHDPHGSLFDNNLLKNPLSLCLDCHNKPIIGTDGKDYNIFQIIEKNPFKHGPIKDGNCTGCHNPHGSNAYKILKKEYPEKFYTAFDRSKYDLCFSCHEDFLVKEEKTTKVTNFRNGNKNLHFIHVNRQKGRTCRACHEVHAGQLAKHIRKETPFGSWDIPIEFEISKTGGKCSPGCHKPYIYDRTKDAK